ncbi:LytTR family DNA-binding domain-containing protein [Camelimonas abortus]|uniref:LytTR family DNA-binding domain-containing protein n=1 Tax=Camelimonas abortus TaxID=1017184 RepID=UPI0035E6E2AD
MRGLRDLFAGCSALQFAKRELQELLQARTFWALVAAGSVILGVTGPFGTWRTTPFPVRLGYWAAMLVVTYVTGHGVVAALRGLWRGERPPGHAAWALFGAAAGLPVTAVVILFNAAASGWPRPRAAVELAAAVVTVSAVTSLLVAMFQRRLAGQGAGATAPPAAAPPENRATAQGGPPAAAAGAAQAEPPAPAPRILQRLPPEARGRLSHMTMQDHYVEVRTDRGGALVLMRFSDAIAETEGVPGLRLHRSHWAAQDMIVALTRADGRLAARMRDGTLLPVSRSRAAAVRAALAGRAGGPPQAG